MTSHVSSLWTDELRDRYLRGESSLFVLHGNVHDSVFFEDSLVGVSDFMAHSVFKKKNLIIKYNVSTGCQFVKKDTDVPHLDALLLEKSPAKILPVLESLLFTISNMALIIEYAEMVIPEGTASFATEQDRLAVVTLQRWSLAHQLDEGDNIVVLLTEALNELHPKVVANPRVASVKIPMPSFESRKKCISFVNKELTDEWIDRFAEITAGLRLVQIKSILQPSPVANEDADSRFHFIMSLIGNETRAKKLAALTHGMTREEIRELVGVESSNASEQDEAQRELDEIVRLISRRKREIIERECFGIIEFVDSSHDFSVVGGHTEIKKSLQSIAFNIREGNKSLTPMGVLFTGPMGTGKTFVAEAFVKESGLTGIKFKNFRSKWVGSTESNLERILNVIQAIGSVIVIIDEGDRAFGAQQDGDSGTNSRVIARLKEFMSDTSHRGRVLFILMTNRPDKLDVDMKRAGRFDRKIPFLYNQTHEGVESVLLAQFRKHGIRTEIEFPAHRKEIAMPLIGYSNADIEAITLLANAYAAESEPSGKERVDKADFMKAVADYLPSRDVEMLEYMELLAVFEASNRQMLPAKYANMSVDELQARLNELRLTCGTRR